MTLDLSFHGRKRCSYPGEESAKHHCDVKRSHDEEIQDAILENRSHQPRHARLAVVGFELEDEDDNANQGNQVCDNVRLLVIRQTEK